MKGFNCESTKNEKQLKSEVIASKIHKRDTKTLSVTSIISKRQKDAGKCYHNAKKPDADMVTLLSEGNAIHKAEKRNQDTFKWLRGGSSKSKEREKKVNAQVAKDRWTRWHHQVLSQKNSSDK